MPEDSQPTVKICSKQPHFCPEHVLPLLDKVWVQDTVELPIKTNYCILAVIHAAFV